MSRDDLILDIIEKIHDKVEKLTDTTTMIQIDLVRQAEMHRINTADLKDHMRRTEALEKQLDFYKSALKIIAWAGGGLVTIVKLIPIVLPFLSH